MANITDYFLSDNPVTAHFSLWHITISTKASAHLKTGSRAYIRRRRTDIHSEAALLKHPAPGSRVIELQHVRSDRKVDCPRLPRFKRHLAETLEFPHRTLNRRLVITDIELHDLLSCNLADIRNIDRHLHISTGTYH